MNVTFRGQAVAHRHQVLSGIRAIRRLADTMKDMEQLDAPVKHTFSKGVYAREITMPEGMVIVGKIHKTRHLNIISKGSCTVVTPLRKIHIEAPHTFESFEGEQKVVYMHSEVIWTTIHLTDDTDIDTIEKQVIAEEYDEQLVDGLINKLGDVKCLGDLSQ